MKSYSACDGSIGGIWLVGASVLTTGAALLNALGVRPKTVAACWIGAVSVSVRDDLANDSTLLITTSEGVSLLWQNLLCAGKAFGLRVGGHWAQEAVRIQRGIPGFGIEATPNRRDSNPLGANS